jgi:hypothetical protein
MPDYHLHTLDDCFERVKRAGEHLVELEKGISETCAQQADAIPLEFDPDPPHGFKLGLPPETFYGMRMGVLVGEICYNLRSALDYLIFHLAQIDSGATQDGTQFPIVDSPKNFVRWTKSWLKGVNSAHIAAIERLQPYNGCNWSERLRELSNPDKHRELVTHLGESRVNIWVGWETDLAKIKGASMRTATHPTRGIVEVKVHVAINVTFSDGSPIIESIQEIIRGVAQTLADFKPEF